jgi:methionine-rich copper-binding protein CopC
VAPGTQNITGTWQVIVSKTNKFDDKSKLKSAASEPPGLTTTAYTFQILDAVVVPSAPAPGSSCPVATTANHSAGTGATGQRIAICGKNRATLALTPIAAQATLGGTFITTSGSFASGSIAANSASSVVLGTWSNVTITGTSGPNKTIIAKVGSASNRTSPKTTLANTCTGTPAGEDCVANGGYTAIDDAPYVTSTSPANGADHVAVNTNIVVTFSESVTVTTSSFSLECPTGTAKSFTVSGSPGSVITLDPVAVLAQGTTCTVVAIASQISDTDALDPPDHPNADYPFSFTTDSAPAVTSTSPANGATAVNSSNNVTVSFSEAVNASGASFTIECPSGSPQAFGVSGSPGSTITLDPNADLPPATTCTVTVLASGISDVDAGDPPDNLAANYVFSFTTADVAPSVASTSPADGADHVAVNANVVVNFSEPVTATGSSFTLECPTATAMAFTVSGSPGSSITLDPTANLPEGTVCTVTVIANQISDTDAVDPPDHMAANYVFSFTTDSAPAVTTTSPADGATDVSATANIVVDFTEPVSVGASSFTISCDGNPQTFQVSGSGTSSITLDPDSDLPTAHCTVTAVAANISDVDTGDPPDHPAANTSFSFATQDAAPTVTSTSPADGADHVAVNTNIVVNFSEPVTATSNSFTLDCPTGTPESFTFSGSPGSSITLDPTADLHEGTVCTVTVIANQISDVDSVDPPDNMATNYVFSFTTDSAPAVTSTTPSDAATEVDPSANITVNFNEAVDVTTSSFTILCDSNPETFTVSGTGTSSITLNPDSDLPSTSSCTVTAVALNISDSDTGDPPDHPASNASFSFTTKDAAPSVTSTSPAEGATGVPIGANIVINFSESVTASGSSFTLECPTGSPQAFTVSGSPGSTITLDPTANLPLTAICTVTVIASGISDTDTVDPPDNMAANYVFSFTTAADQAPTDIALSHSSVDENQPSGTTVGTLSTTDPDPGDTFTYSFATGTGDTDNASFQIVGDTLKTNAIFDFETKSSYSIRVRSTDSGSMFFEKVFTITINDVNEAPTNISLSNSSIDENQPSNTTVGALTATDPDAGQTHTFTLQNTGCGGGPFSDNASFAISGSDLKSAVSFDFETKSSYTICVRTTDSGSPTLSFDKQFTITINDVNDAPVANPDSYSGAIGNTLAVVQTTATGPHVTLTGNGLIANDTDQDATFPHTLAATAETVTSTGGGTATINADGSFTFLPGVGDKNQDDTFTYHVTDGSVSTAGTATIHIDDFLVWYVDNASAAATHDGRSSSPFLNLSSINGAGGSGDSDGPDDFIFLYQGSGSYGGGIPLEATQKLFGEKHGLLVDGHQLVNAGATAPVITNASGTGVGLANGVDVQGLNISGTSGDAINGSAVTTATVGTTTAVNISSAGGDGVDLSGAASGNISIASPIIGSVGHSVSVAGRTGGTVAFSGAISDAGTGILLSGNTGATINLTGGVTASTGTSNAFVATGGGTINVTGSANTLATTTGTPLDVENTTIGSSNLTFRSVSANGAVRGIVLIGTGSSGHLSVTGTGSAGTGGTLASIAGADVATNNCADLGSSAPAGVGVYLKNTTSPSLSYMSFTGTFGNFGILGYSVNNFTLDNTTLTGTFGDNVNQDEDTVHFCTLTGSASITNDTISNGAETNLRVINASGTLNRLTMSNSTIGLNQTNGGDGTLFEADGGTFKATVEDTTFQGSRGSPFQAVPQAGATMDLVFGSPGHGNSIHNTHGNIVSFAQDLNVAAGGTLTFDIDSNHFDSAAAVQAQGGVFINAANSTAVASGYFRNNTIGNSGVLNSGSSGNDPALDVESNGGGDLTIKVDNNQLYQWGANGAGFLLQAGATSGNAVTLNATVTNNTISQPGTFAVTSSAQGFQLNNGTQSGENFTTCLRFASNVLNGSGTGAGGDARFRQRFDTKVTLPGYTGASNGGTLFADMITYIVGLNPPAPLVSGASSTTAGGGFFNTPGGAACALPGF